MLKFDKRFGTIAIEDGFVTKEQLQEAISLQVHENIEDNKHRLIGAILIELGYITKEQVLKILTLMKNVS